MQPVPQPDGVAPSLSTSETTGGGQAITSAERWARLAGQLIDLRQAQELFPDESLEQALRQLTLYGRAGLPVISHDGTRLEGWLTRQNVLSALAQSVESSDATIERGVVAADVGYADPETRAHTPSTPLGGYQIVEITIGPDSPALGRRVEEIAWPSGSHVVAITENRELVALQSNPELRAGERVVILAPTEPTPPPAAAVTQPSRVSAGESR